jgi:hypothetical protein
MSLGVTIVDNKSQKILNEGGINYGILLDDTITVIKEKIFAHTENFFAETLLYYPNFLKLEIRENHGKNTVITGSNCLLTYYKTLPQTPLLYITSILNFTVNVDYDLYNKMKKDEHISLYEKLVTEFVDLTLDDFNIIIKMKMYDLNKRSDIPILSSQESDILKTDLEEFFINLKTIYESLQNQYKRETDSLKKFYNVVYKTKDFSKFYPVTDGIPEFTFTNVTLTIPINHKKEIDADGEPNSSTRNLKLQKVFDILELSDIIPLVAFNESPRTNPKIKVYNHLIEHVSENTIRSWIFNEKKKLQQVSYKRLRGLMIKYYIPNLNTSESSVNNYITLLLDENASITVKISLDEDNTKSLDNIIDIITSEVNLFITTLNQLTGIFISIQRLPPINKSNILVHSLNAKLETTIAINKTKFKKMLTKYEISKIFQAKDIMNPKDKRQELISIYYKRFGKREIDDTQTTERLGITVNLKDNPYKSNSSLIVIYGAYNYNQLQTIVNEIMITSILSEETSISKNIFEDSDSEEEETLVKERKQNIKLLREKGIKIFSTKCQKTRQPIMITEQNKNSPDISKDDQRFLDHKASKYYCPNDDYKYPGFTVDNILCCFKKPGRGITRNISTDDILEIKVQPSNLLININNIQTYAIKVISDNVDHFDLEFSRFFYLKKHSKTEFPLEHITDPAVIKYITEHETNPDTGDSIWLDEVSLNHIVSKPNKNNCLHIPRLNHTNHINDINEPCKHFEREKIFGYNLKSYPCCFEEQPPIYRSKKEIIKSDITKQHILTTDKLLDSKRQGILPPGVNILFNEIIQPRQNDQTEGAFLRWGVNQNRLSFLNCIVECIGDGDFSINNIFELKRYLVNYLTRNPNEFNRLNSGNISLKYDNLENYITAINQGVNWNDIIDLIQITLGCNILILDIPYIETQSTKKYNYEDVRLICNPHITLNRKNPFIILLRRENSFEIVVQNTIAFWNPSLNKIQLRNLPSNIKDTDPKIKFFFKFDENSSPKTNIINFLLDYYKSSCIKEYSYPKEYPYDELYEINDLIKTLGGTPFELWFQLTNVFNKVNLVVTKSGLVLPIKEIGRIRDLKYTSFDDFVIKNKALDISNTLQYIEQFNKIVKVPLRLTGMTVRDGFYTGAMTNFGQIIPVKNTPVDQVTIKIPILNTKYYYDVDQYLIGTNVEENNQSIYNNQIHNQKTVIVNVKTELAKMDQSAKTTIQSIITNTKMDKVQKTNEIHNILLDNLSKDTKANIRDIDFITNIIANEIINDNIEALYSEPDSTIQTTKPLTESVWLNIHDIKKWINKFQIKN